MLPVTGMMMLGAPLAGVVITRTGPRLPMFAGMLLAAVPLLARKGHAPAELHVAVH